ncbi:MAG: RHS repeat-associated core domain-containing protein, partial [Candidatus Izemoplasmatales bacterium]
IKYTIEDNYLSEISSLDNNLSLIITRDSTNISHVQTITDTTGNRIELSYLNGNLNTGLLKTKDESGNYHNIEKVYYKYSSNGDNLVEVYYLTDYNQDNDLTLVYQDLSNVDKVSKYQYYSSNRLYRTYVMHVKSEDGTFSESMGEEIRYHYIGSSNKISYLESYFNSTKYSQVNYDNKPEQTKITDHTGEFVIYKFDDYGHTVNIIDNEGSSIYYDYIDIFSNQATYINGEDYNYELANQIVNQSSPQKTIFNPIENYSFENNLNGWEIYPNNENQFLTTENEAVTGMFSLEISNQGDEWGYASQLIYLENGIYNISVDVKNTGIDNDVVYVNIQGSANPVQYVPNDGVWHRLTFNIDVGDSYSGQTIYLVSKTTGSVFFDNLIFYESYNSNRVNLLDNPSFEFGLTDNWKQNDNYYDTQYHVYSINDGSGATNDLFEEVLGELALGLNGEIYTIVERNYFENMIDSNGSVFIGGWANRYSAPQVKNANLVNGKFFRILVQQLDSSGNVIIDNNGLVIEELHYSLSYDSWQYVYEEVVIHENCDKLQVSLQYFGEGEVIFDGLSLFYHASSSSYEYDEHGRIKKVYQDDGIYTYSYIDTEEEVAIYPHQITDQDGYSIEIEQDGSKITSVSCNNVKTSPTYDPNGTGLVIGYKVYGEGETQPYFTTSTTYNHNSQYLHTTTDEFNETTTYYTNVLTGLLESIENSKYVDTNYEYYDNGLLKKVYIYNTGVYDMSYVEYIYDEYDKLVEIKMDSNYSYKIFYDSIGRIETVKVNNQTLMSYDYLVDTYETDKLTMQEYGNGDIIYFVYDDDNSNISEIKFQGSNLTPETRFTYKYDSLGRTSIYHDIINNITEQYEYDFNGNLINIRYNNGDIIEYSYDDEGNLVNISCNISNYDSSVSYDYHENIENQKLYDNTKYNLNDSTDLYKDYIYTDDEEVFDPLGRLLKIQFSRKVFEVSTNIFNISYDYEDYTSRINKISYHFEDSQEQDFEYEYLYDELGNIIQDKYVYYDSNSQSNKSVIKTYVYDNLNQIIQENSRDTSYSSSTYSSTNYTKYYHYDIRGNITGIKSMKYGETEYVNPSIPSFFLRNNGTYSASVFYNGNNDYQDIYNLNIGETPSLSFVYYDKWDTFHDFPLSSMNTTLQYSNLNTSVSGYYYSTYRATYGNYDVRFKIVYRVGNPQPTLLTPQKEVSMSYNSMWLDQLESYDVVSNGITITSEIEYDNQGNPILITNFLYDGLNRNHAALVWEGRKLVEIKIYNSSDDSILRAKICYTYNDSGIRLSKTIDDMQYNSKDKRIVYGVSNDILISEKVYSLNGSNWVEDYQIGYIYDYDGTLIGFKHYDVTGMTNYLYIKNIQGDITKIIEEDGTVVVEYFYDGYGNIVKTEGTLKNTIGTYNSLRYRSYKYDNEIGMYYLNSRYYNPEIGRFISSDGLLGEMGNIKSTNMYAYCANNPVMFTDSTGYFWDTVLDVGFLIWSIVDVWNDPSDLKNWAALGADLLFMAIPFATGGSKIIKAGNNIDDAVDVVNAINKVDNVHDLSKITVIGRDMNRVGDVAGLLNRTDDIYDAWKGYDITATGLKKFIHNGLSMFHNGGWLLGKLRSGYTVLDIGLSTAHRTRGLWYGTERVVTSVWKTRHIWKLPLNYYW